MKKSNITIMIILLGSILLSSCGISISRNYYYGYQKNSDKPIEIKTSNNVK